MAKKGPFSKAERFYIEHHWQELDIEELAADLDRTQKSLEAYIKKTFLKKSSSTAITAGEQFISKKGSTVMTENASTISDAKRRRPTLNPSCVRKIKHD
tara:strand:- start:2436 stop:2732 length:297 start_codon:yes stop_codon:yes gene_type:complete